MPRKGYQQSPEHRAKLVTTHTERRWDFTPVQRRNMRKINATFHCFRESGKWYESGRGVLDKIVYELTISRERREAILFLNHGKYPGLEGRGDDMIFVVVPDEAADIGFPLMLKPNEA